MKKRALPGKGGVLFVVKKKVQGFQDAKKFHGYSV